MKQLFIVRLFNAIVEAAGGTTPAPELTSETLTNLKAERKAAWAECIKHEDPDTAEALAAKMALYAIDGKIAAEKQALQKAAAEAVMAEKRSERLKLNQNQFDAYDNLLKIKADKKATPEAIAEAQTAFDTAKELVNNELLKSVGGAPKAKKQDGEAGTSKTSENKTAILDLYRSGKTHKEIEAEGFKRSTVWHVINNAIESGEVEKLH